MKEKICCCLGLNDAPENKLDCIKQALRCEIVQAIKDDYTLFPLALATDTGFHFAKLVLDIKKENPAIEVVAFIPKLDIVNTPLFEEILAECDMVAVLGEKRYPFYYEFMISPSKRIIVVEAGRIDMPYTALSKAQLLKKEIRFININN